MLQRNTILMIAYFFPPIGGSGSIRPLKLAKYLPLSGWHPIVLTVKNHDWYYAYDKDLLDELPRQVQIERSFMLRSAWLYRLMNPLRNRKIDIFLRRFIIQPDDQIGWIPFAYKSALKLIQNYKVHAVYSTSAPLSCHIIAKLLKAKTGIPWIADFRDEWYENPDQNYPSSLHRSLHYYLEKDIVNTADRIIAPAMEFCRLLSKHTSDNSKFSTIYMGFDPDDFPDESTHEKLEIDKDKFVTTFSGLFYGSFRPDNLLTAINSLIDEGSVEHQKVKIRFVGANSPNDINVNDKFSICEFTGFVSHEKTIKYLAISDVLLLLLSDKRGKNVVPSKTFEYLATGKPLIASVPANGDVADIIRKTNSGIIIDFDDVNGIKNAYLKLYQQWKDKKEYHNPDLSEMAKYDQKNLTKRFASLLDDISLR